MDAEKIFIGGIGTAAVFLILRDLNIVAPKGIRNNNPGNLRPMPSGDKWDGESGVDSANLLIFAAPQWGLRAAAKNLAGYSTRHGLYTIWGMAQRWAPSSDNNEPIEYAATVAKIAGYAVTTPLNFSDAEINFRVLKGIIRAENGLKLPLVEWFNDGEIRAAIALAGLK